MASVAGGWLLYTNNLSQGYKDATYSLDGREITLLNGVAVEGAALALAPTLVAEYLDDGDIKSDFNNDGLKDVAFFFTQTGDGGGSNTFYYVTVALKTAGGYQGVNAVLLGNNIAQQKMSWREGEIVVSYLTRAFGESLTAKPSVKITKYLKLSGLNLVESRLPDVGEFRVHNNLILIIDPIPEAKIQNPTTVTGIARSDWYSDESFSVVLFDGNGEEISAALAKIKAGSKSTDFLPFTATLNFIKPDTQTGVLIFKKINQSGMSVDSDSISVPVQF